MRIKIFHTLVVAAFLAAVAPVMTVTNGEPDGNGHPYVGTVIQFIPNTSFIAVCSGSALSTTRFLTAAHCADPSLPVFVSYKSGRPFAFPADFTQGTFNPDPDWCIGCGPGLPGFDSHDVAVVALLSANNPGVFCWRWERASISSVMACRDSSAAAGSLGRFSCSRGTSRQAC